METQHRVKPRNLWIFRQGSPSSRLKTYGRADLGSRANWRHQKFIAMATGCPWFPVFGWHLNFWTAYSQSFWCHESCLDYKVKSKASLTAGNPENKPTPTNNSSFEKYPSFHDSQRFTKKNISNTNKNTLKIRNNLNHFRRGTKCKGIFHTSGFHMMPPTFWDQQGISLELNGTREPMACQINIKNIRDMCKQ